LIHCYFDRILLTYTTNTNIQTAKRVPKASLAKKTSGRNDLKQRQRIYILHEAACRTVAGSTRIAKSNRGGECQWVGTC